MNLGLPFQLGALFLPTWCCQSVAHPKWLLSHRTRRSCVCHPRILTRPSSRIHLSIESCVRRVRTTMGAMAVTLATTRKKRGTTQIKRWVQVPQSISNTNLMVDICPIQRREAPTKRRNRKTRRVIKCLVNLLRTLPQSRSTSQ